MSLENTAWNAEDEEFVDELKPGTKLMHGQYTIEGFLAAGGFGITYLARDSLDRTWIDKIYSEQARENAYRESQRRQRRPGRIQPRLRGTGNTARERR